MITSTDISSTCLSFFCFLDTAIKTTQKHRFRCPPLYVGRLGQQCFYKHIPKILLPVLGIAQKEEVAYKSNVENHLPDIFLIAALQATSVE